MKKNIIISGVSVFTVIVILAGLVVFLPKSSDLGTTLVDGLIPQKEFNDKGHLTRDESAKTDEFSLMYKNKDGSKSLYVFTSPVQFLNNGKYQLIDNTLIDSGKGYIYKNKNNDIHTYYPNMKEQDDFLIQHEDKTINMQAINNNSKISKINKKTIFDAKQEMVEYYKDKNMSVSYFTTNLGLKCQITIDNPIESTNFDFAVSSELLLDSRNEKYFAYKDSTNKTGAILYQPVAVDNDGNILNEYAKITLLSSEKNASEMSVALTPNVGKKQYPVTVEFTLNMYKGNQVDSSVQSRKPNNNQYLDNYLYVGKASTLGEAESYVRFETNVIDDYILKNTIKSVKYNCYGLAKNQTNLSVYDCDNHWTSTKITWNTRQAFDRKLNDFELLGVHIYSADMTELVRSWANDRVKKDCGFSIRSEEEQFEVLASSDNGYMMPRMEIRTEVIS